MNSTFEGHTISYVSKKKYPAIYLNGKIVRIHTLVMERKLGRPLRPGEVVHHIDEDVNNFDESNLICFASNSDHAGYHMGNDLYFDNEGIAHCVPSLIKLGEHRYKHCPNCGGLMSHTANVCKNCRNSTNRPSKEELTQDLKELKTYTAIGRKYNVTGNAIKKWCKYYGLYENKISELPHKQNFMHYLEKHTIDEASLHYGVTKSIISSWIERMHIHIGNQQILCVETNTIYLSGIDVANKLFPNMNPKGVSNKLRRVLNTSNTYKGYYWKSLCRLVTSD